MLAEELWRRHRPVEREVFFAASTPQGTEQVVVVLRPRFIEGSTACHRAIWHRTADGLGALGVLLAADGEGVEGVMVAPPERLLSRDVARAQDPRKARVRSAALGR